MKELSDRERWQAAARSRLRMELSGLAFAARRGHSPEEYAQELWGRGARAWMGKTHPDPLEYLEKEAQGMATLYPWIETSTMPVGPALAELVMTGGCLAGWGEDPWALARRLGLSQDQVCLYCQEAFRVWGQQLGLAVSLQPQADGTCVLRAAKED